MSGQLTGSQTNDQQTSPSGRPLTAYQKEAKRFIKAMGTRGGVLFFEGKSFEDAADIVIAELNEVIRRKEEEIRHRQDEIDGLKDENSDRIRLV